MYNDTTQFCLYYAYNLLRNLSLSGHVASLHHGSTQAYQGMAGGSSSIAQTSCNNIAVVWVMG